MIVVRIRQSGRILKNISDSGDDLIKEFPALCVVEKGSTNRGDLRWVKPMVTSRHLKLCN